MKTRVMVLGAVMVCAFYIWAPVGLAQSVPPSINYQGQLTDAMGVPITGDTVQMSFRLLDADTVTATVLWGETHNAVLVTDGLYHAILGSLNPIPAPTFAGTTVYLEVRVDGEIFRPRARLTSVAYAVQAQNAYACVEADKLDGQDAAAFASSSHQHAGADISSGAVGTDYFSAASDLSAEGLLDNNADADLLTRLQADGRYVNTTGDDAMAGSFRVDGKLSVGSGGTPNLADGPGDVYVRNDLEVDGFLYAKGHIFLYAMEGDGLSGTAYVQARDLSGTSSINLRLRTQSAGVLVEAAIVKSSGLIHVGPSGTEDFVDGAGDLYVQDELEVDGVANFSGGINAPGAIDAADVSFNYAGSGSKGGAASDLSCTDCVAASEVQFNYAGSASEGGAASDLTCVDCVGATEVQFNYAASPSEGGAAASAWDLACTNCVSAAEVQFNYAGSLSEGGAASDLSCTDCVASTEVQFNYAGSASEGGAATSALDLACTDCVASTEVQFNYAASASKGGAATNALAVDIAYLRNLDLDGDGHYKPISTNTPNDDCDDGDPEIYFGHAEICGDGVDNNCRNGDCSIMGNLDTDDASDVFILGKYAYVADGDVGTVGGMRIIDISDPALPVLVSYYTHGSGHFYSVVVVGRYAYLADGPSGLMIVDVLNPAAPVFVSGLALPDSANDVFVAGSYAYVADNTAGLKIINISNPAAPTLTGTYDTTGLSSGVYVSGNYAYVADSNSGLQIIDVSVPATPTLTGTYNTPGVAFAVYVSGSYAYVADATSGLKIVNVSTPSAPTLAGSIDTPDIAINVQYSSGRAIVADRTSGVHIIDVSTPSAPTLTLSSDTPGTAKSALISGEYLYVADGGSGLQVIRFMTPP